VVRSRGVSTSQYTLVDSGPLAEAVVASACIPVLFMPMRIPGRDGRWADGGKHDRVGLRGWRARRRAQSADGSVPPPALVHVIQRSSPFSGDDDLTKLAAEEEHSLYIQTPKSGRSLLDFGDYHAEFDAVRNIVAAQLASADAPGCFHVP
jgi:predicted acylesterase/phospholipase RssA